MTTAQTDSLRLRGKVAVVTGAARGIGEAIALAFIQEGAFVYLTDLRDGQGADRARSLGANARYCHLDVRDEAQWEHVLAQVLDEHEGLHVLVNNAGITGFEDAGGLHDPEHVSLAQCVSGQAGSTD